MCVFFGEGDLQMNGLMIKAIAVVSFCLFGWVFFLSLPSLPKLGSWAGWDVWEGRMVRDRERLKSIKKPFWLLKNISGKSDSTGWGRTCFRCESQTTFFLKTSTFGYLGMRQRAREERASGGHRALLLPGKDACVVKGWKRIKKQRNKQRNEKAGVWALQKQ